MTMRLSKRPQPAIMKLELPMTLEDLRKQKRDAIMSIAARHGVTGVRVFGSFARGEARPDSDLDLLIEAGPQTPQWFPGGLLVDLEEELGRKVDVAEEKTPPSADPRPHPPGGDSTVRDDRLRPSHFGLYP